MLKNIEWPYTRSYRSDSEYEPLEFYLSAFSSSTSADLLLGYFSFSAVNVLSLGFARFISNGGKLRVVANDILSKRDRETIEMASEPGRFDGLIDFGNLKDLKSRLDSYSMHFFECMAWLIQNQRIEFVLIRPKGRKGISHYKTGLFNDGENEVMFSGSCNFTAYGMVENLERLDAYLSWEDSRSNKKILDQKLDFENLFFKRDATVEYVPVSEVKEVIKEQFGEKELSELVSDEQELLRMKQGMEDNPRLSKILRHHEDTIEQISRSPRFPYESGPRDYQREAYNNWVANGYKGLFAMATGTGKTITSLNCLLEEYKKSEDEVYHALILVPTITLVEQWADEAKGFNFQEIIKVSSKEKWESRLATSLSTAKRVPTSFVIISTYASFVKDRFNKYTSKLPSDTLFIADEAHNIGAPSVMAKLEDLPIIKRIGLSATPKRIYDPEGSEAMAKFFNDEEPFTYTFSMEKAIIEGILCQYDYHPHLVELTEVEMDDYVAISKTLSRFYNPESVDGLSNDIAQRLLLKRKRIIHKAENKLAKTLEILNERYEKEKSLRYTFVYVPEGTVSSNYDVPEDLGESEEENLKVITTFTHAIGEIDDSVLVNQFVSGMSDRLEVLEQFKSGKIQVIASMKCLDEGVDIPRAEHAIFCSSTGNPRQFIQRRGRILRKHPDKFKATIHDLVVIPDLSASEEGSATYNLERNLVKKEIERVMYFASLAQNPYETERVFDEVCDHYNLNIYSIYEELKSNE